MSSLGRMPALTVLGAGGVDLWLGLGAAREFWHG